MIFLKSSLKFHYQGRETLEVTADKSFDGRGNYTMGVKGTYNFSRN
jgi:ribosomal protein L5